MFYKRKKIIKSIILLGILLVMLFSGLIVKASNIPVVHYIFDKQQIEEGEEFSLTIILENYKDLSSFQFVCDIDESVFIPIKKNNEYFLEPALSLFDKEEIYEKIYITNENLLKFIAITKGDKTYDYSGLNQVFTINFKAKKNIDDVKKYFYDNEAIGSRVLLIDKKAKEIKVNHSYNEILKVTWEKDIYEVEVLDLLPNIKKDIVVLNREESEYKIEIIDEEIDLNQIGSYILKIKIYDYITSQIIYLAKPIRIIDSIAPDIEVEEEKVILEDIKIESHKFDFFKVRDNYDQNPTLLYKYYDKEGHEIHSLEEFKRYLKNNNLGKISLSAIDGSNNQSIEKTIIIEIKDTIAPYINELKFFEVIDTKVKEFDLESLFFVKDEYDPLPQINYMIISDVSNYKSYLEVLENLYKVTIEYWAVDKSNNESKHYVLEINVKDTIAPVIDGVHDIQIADEDLLLYLNNHHLLEQDLEISDNLNNKLELKITYYDNNKIINEDAFFKNLKRGIGGNIIYQVIDSFGNKSEEVFQKVSVIDDTPPIITINNLENRKQYLGPVNIDYVIEDNIDEEIDIEIIINGNRYQGEELIELKEYNLVITAVDKSGNKTTKEINFEIVEENFFGCIDGFDCEENNYAVGIIIGIVIIVIVGVVVTLEILYIKKKKREEYLEE